jgi:hypothetical protein
MTAANLEMIEVYTKDIKAWFTDEELGWVSASVVLKEHNEKSVKIVFQDDNDYEKVVAHEQSYFFLTGTNWTLCYRNMYLKLI